MFCFLLFISSNPVFCNPLSVHTDVLYWSARQGGADNWAQAIPAPLTTNTTIQILDVPFRWTPGFRIGLGYTLPQNFWNVKLNYTQYQTKGKDQTQPGTNTGVYSSFLGNFYVNNPQGNGVSGPYYQQAQIQWDLGFHNLDLEFSHLFSLDSHFSLKPIIGMKTAIINQDISSNWQRPFNPSTHTPYSNFTSASEDLSNHFWGIGPSLGLDTYWHLHHSANNVLSIYGGALASLMYGYWQVNDIYQNDQPAKVNIINGQFNSAATMTQLRAGIELTHVKKTTQIKAHIGYEGQVWFNQMRFYSFNEGRLNNPLSLHGLAAGINVTPNFESGSQLAAASERSATLTPFAELLYWRASEETSSTWASVISLDTQLKVSGFDASNVYFPWEPGIRTGLTLSWPEAMDIRVYWTHFTSQANERINALTGQIITPEFFNGFTSGDVFNAAKLKWQLQFNQIDGELGHEVTFKNSLKVRPFVGIKGGQIKQSISSQWDSLFYSSTEQLRNNFTAVGPSFGLDSQWALFKSLTLVGNFSTAFLWGKWNITDQYARPQALFGLIPAREIDSNTKNSMMGTMMYRYLVGLEWKNHWSTVPVHVRAGYEMQYWTNQLRIPTFQQLPLRGDLTLQGLTCSLSLSF